MTARRTEFEVACNWKSYIEVFNEYYHLPTVHPDSITHLYDTPDDTDIVSGNYTTQFGTTQGTAALLDDARDKILPPIKTLDGRNRQGTRYTWTYPNMTFAASIESVWMFDVYPIAPGRSRVGMTICFTPEAMQLPDYEARAKNTLSGLIRQLAKICLYWKNNIPDSIHRLPSRGVSPAWSRVWRILPVGMRRR